MRFRALLGLFLLTLDVGCAKPVQPTLSIEETNEARQHFQRHLLAIGANPTGIPHTGLKINGSMEIMGEPGKHLFAIEQQMPNRYYIRITLSGVGVFERGYDGTQLWERTPRESRFLSNEEVNTLGPTMDFQRWKNNEQWYPTVLHKKTVSFGGESCTALRVKTHMNTEETLLFSTETDLLMGIEKHGEEPSVIRFGQYLTQGDVKMPTYWEEQNGAMHKIWRVESLVWDRNDVDFRPPPSLLEER